MIARRSVLQSIAATSAAACMPQIALGSAATSAWRLLFNGRNLDGWTIFEDGEGNSDPHGAIRIEKGVLHMFGPSFSGPDIDGKNRSSFGHIATTSIHGNYHLRMDFRFDARGFLPRALQRRNSGLLYHMAPELDRLFPDCV